MIRRRPDQIARRAMVLGAIAFRASLEVTDHPRAVGLSERLLPWLAEVGCDGEVEPAERELLATACGRLTDGQRVDANWAGEDAMFLCWALGLVGPAPEAAPADASELLDVLKILRPEAVGVVRAAAIRDEAAVARACLRTALLLAVARASRVEGPAREIVRRALGKMLEARGVRATAEEWDEAERAFEAMVPVERERAAGLCFVRAHCATWLVGDRPRYMDGG